MSKIQKSQAGFTLIELVMVIVILGILAATALPKFVDISADARAGVMKGVEGSMRAANTMLYAKAAANSQLGATGSVTVGGNPVALAYGYAKDVAELSAVMTLSPASDFTVVNTETEKQIRHASAKTVGANCAVSYTAATSTAEPGYATVTSAC